MIVFVYLWVSSGLIKFFLEIKVGEDVWIKIKRICFILWNWRIFSVFFVYINLGRDVCDI